MRWVGITGRSGSGKSSVTAYLRGQGCACLDADALARRLLAPGTESCKSLLPRLQNAFGYDIVDSTGALDRALLAHRAFAGSEAAQRLNAITHPALLALAQAEAEKAERAGERLFFLDGAAIVGGIFEARCDLLVLVTAPYAQSVARICRRDGIPEAEARRRLDAQTPESVLRAAADYVLENTGTLPELQSKAAALLEALRRLP